MDSINQNSVYYDPQRDVSVSGATQSVTNSESHVVQSANSYVPYPTSVQQDYNAVQHPNHYYNYPQVANDSSVQRGVDQGPGAAYQPLTSFPKDLMLVLQVTHIILLALIRLCQDMQQAIIIIIKTIPGVMEVV